MQTSRAGDSIEYFYSNEDTEESSEQSFGSLEDLLNAWEQVADSTDGFFGFFTADRQIVQVSLMEDGECILDLPVVEKQGSWTKPIDREDFPTIITAVLNGQNPQQIAGLEFHPWSD